MPNKIFQQFETPEVESAFQTYQAKRAISVVFWIILGGISIGIVFAIEGLSASTLNIPLVSHIAWVVPLVILTLWLRSSHEQFIAFYRPTMFVLGILCISTTLGAIALADVETFRIIKKGTLLAVFGYLALLRIELKQSLILSAIAILGFTLVLLHHQVPSVVLVQDVTEIVIASLMGSVANWLIENESRAGFLLTHDLTIKIEEVERARLALADEVKEHRATLSQLDGARQEAVQASQAKSDFLAAVSHELRTPMNGMVGAIQLLDTTTLSNEQLQYQEVLASSAQNLSLLLDDLFDLTRIEVGLMRIEPTPTNLHQLLRQIETNSLRSAVEQTIDLRFEWDQAVLPRWVLLDPKRVTQILANLIQNSLKFTQNGWVRLKATATTDRIQFSVSDTGKGLPLDAQSIFQKYHQELAGQGGLGLGLSICQMLTDHMGGSISAHHRQGGGAELRVEIPLIMANEPSIVQTPAALVQQHRQHAHVLVVEDNPINQKVARWSLEQLGCTVKVAADGTSALRQLEDEHVDLVIMDCEMPGMSGYEITQNIRRTEDAMSRLPIIALTAHATLGARERCLEAGMDDYLAKPFRKADLQRVLERWLPA